MDRFAPSEMEIVDTFTHAIFSGGEALSPREVSILETLCQVDYNAAHCVGEQATGNLGRYLRDLGVKEMELLSNTERTIIGLEGYGLTVAGRRPIPHG